MRSLIAAAALSLCVVQSNSVQAQTSPLRCGIENMQIRREGETTYTYFDRVFCIITENAVTIERVTSNRGNCNLRTLDGTPGKQTQYGERVYFSTFPFTQSNCYNILDFTVHVDGLTYTWNAQ